MQEQKKREKVYKFNRIYICNSYQIIIRYSKKYIDYRVIILQKYLFNTYMI